VEQSKLKGLKIRIKLFLYYTCKDFLRVCNIIQNLTLIVTFIAGVLIESLSRCSTEHVLKIRSSLLFSLNLLHPIFRQSHAQLVDKYLSASTSTSILLSYARHTRTLHLLDKIGLVKITAY